MMHQLGIAIIWIFCIAPNICAGDNVLVKGSFSGERVCEEFAKAFREIEKDAVVAVDGCPNSQARGLLAGDECDVVVLSVTSKEIMDDLQQSAAKNDGIRIYSCGSFAVKVFVNNANPVNELDLAQLKECLCYYQVPWKRFGGTNATVQAVSEHVRSKSIEIMYRIVFPDNAMGDEAKFFTESGKVASYVAETPNAIGFALDDQQKDPTGVHALRIKLANGVVGRPVREDIWDRTYPLQEELLRSLNLSEAKVGDVQQLACLTKLKSLDTRRCAGLSQDDLARLAKRLPECKIESTQAKSHK